MVDVKRLRKLGFGRIAGKIEKFEGTKEKLLNAYRNYKYVTQEKVDAFNGQLRNESSGSTYKHLSFIGIEDYDRVPPDSVLEALEYAKKDFDKFEIAYIETVKKDPILFGRIEGCSDRFFIAEWDDDVSLEDILLAEEKDC